MNAAQPAPADHEPVSYVPGRAGVSTVDSPGDLDDDHDDDGFGDGGRDGIALGLWTRSEWLTEEWTKQIDTRLDALVAELYDLTQQIRGMAITVLTTYLVLIVVLAALVAVNLL